MNVQNVNFENITFKMYCITVLTILCLASQPEVEKRLRLVEYSARYAVGLFLDNGPLKDVDWGMKYFDDPVIRYIAINGGRTVTGIYYLVFIS